MTVMLSPEILTSEIQLLTTVVIGVLSYVAVILVMVGREHVQSRNNKDNSSRSRVNQKLWLDVFSSAKRYPLSSVFQYGCVYYLSAFRNDCLLQRTLPSLHSLASPMNCVSRSRSDTDRTIHPLIKKIESRLRRSQLRPRPRLLVDKANLPFPLYSSAVSEQDVTANVIEFLDSSIELSVSCDTQIHFALECLPDGVKVSALWKKNDLIADATSQIDLHTDMRLTFQGEIIRWEYHVYFCPQLESSLGDFELAEAKSA